jgi:hypothetical protein
MPVGSYLRLSSVCIGVALSVAAAPSAWAQAAANGGSTPAAASPPAAAPAPPKPAPPAPAGAAPAISNEDAGVRFKRGLELFEEGEYKLALVEFERAYELAPNFRALYNVALVNIQLGRYAEATRKFQAYLHDGGDAVPQSRRAEVTKTLSELELRTATIELSANIPGVHIQLDGKPVSVQVPGSLLIDAGEHTISATSPGYDRVDKSITLAGTDKAAVKFTLVPVIRQTEGGPEVGRTHLFIPGIVATGALAIGGAVSFGLMLNANSTLNQLKANTPYDPGNAQTYVNRVNTAALVADILGGLAVVSGAVTIYISLRTEKDKPKPSVTPSVAITPTSASLAWSF